jgi:predicted permease
VGDFIDVFIRNILPIFIVAAMGFVLRSRQKIDIRSVSRVSFYIFSPALVFSALVNTTLSSDELIDLALFTVVVVILMGIVALGFSLLMRLSRPETTAMLLVVMFVNGGNYGLTLNQLRYGQAGLDRAIVYFMVSTMLVFTLGVFIASLGKANWRQSLKRLVTLPSFYAVISAILVYNFSISLPEPILLSIDLAGAAAIPTMLIVLGMQLADLSDLGRIRLAIPASLIRLLIGPIVGVVVASVIGLQGLSRSTAIIEASTPTAVINTILATEFEVRPGLVTATVVVSTLLSAITLPVVITLLGL